MNLRDKKRICEEAMEEAKRDEEQEAKTEQRLRDWKNRTMKHYAIGGATLLLGVAIAGWADQVNSGRAETGVFRVMLVQQKSVEVLRVRREPGSVEPAGTHPFDVVIIPLAAGKAELTVDGRALGEWKAGEAFFVPRNTEHHFANVGATPLMYITVRIP